MTITDAPPATLTEAVEHFAHHAHSRRYLVSKRWPHGITCPRCGARRPYVDTSRGWECRTRHPRRRFTLKTGTVFEDSPLGFDKWLPAIWVMANHTRATAKSIARTIGVTHQTAWFMLLRVRLALQHDDTPLA